MVYKNAIYNSLQNSFYCLQNDNRIYRRGGLRFIISSPYIDSTPAFPEKATTKPDYRKCGCFFIRTH